MTLYKFQNMFLLNSENKGNIHFLYKLQQKESKINSLQKTLNENNTHLLHDLLARKKKGKQNTFSYTVKKRRYNTVFFLP